IRDFHVTGVQTCALPISSRLDDLKRWSKLEYMDTDVNTDLLSGGWVNFPAQLPSELVARNVGILSVVDLQGRQTVYNGTNGAAKIGRASCRERGKIWEVG